MHFNTTLPRQNSKELPGGDFLHRSDDSEETEVSRGTTSHGHDFQQSHQPTTVMNNSTTATQNYSSYSQRNLNLQLTEPLGKCFTLFPSLCRELRNKIWEYAAFQPRTVMINYLVQVWSREETQFDSGVVGQRRHPAILQTSKEAREEGLRHYARINELPRSNFQAFYEPGLEEWYHQRLNTLQQAPGNLLFVNFAADLFQIAGVNGKNEIIILDDSNGLCFDVGVLERIQNLVIRGLWGTWRKNLVVEAHLIAHFRRMSLHTLYVKISVESWPRDSKKRQDHLEVLADGFKKESDLIRYCLNSTVPVKFFWQPRRNVGNPKIMGVR